MTAHRMASTPILSCRNTPRVAALTRAPPVMGLQVDIATYIRRTESY